MRKKRRPQWICRWCLNSSSEKHMACVHCFRVRREAKA